MTKALIGPKLTSEENILPKLMCLSRSGRVFSKLSRITVTVVLFCLQRLKLGHTRGYG